MASKMQEGSNNPAIGMFAMLKGFGMAIDDMDFPSGDAKMTNLLGSVSVFTDQPEAMLAMAAGQVPALANVSVKPGDAPKALPPEAMAALPADMSATAKEAYVAMGKNQLMFGLGKNSAASMASALKAPATTNGTLFEVGYGGKLFAKAIEQAAKEDSKQTPEERAAMAKVMSALFNHFQSLNTQMGFTSQGLIYTSETIMAPLKQ
jgi:hypothetical protein